MSTTNTLQPGATADSHASEDAPVSDEIAGAEAALAGADDTSQQPATPAVVNELLWDGDPTSASMAPIDGVLEDPMYAEKTAIAPSAPPPAAHAPDSLPPMPSGAVSLPPGGGVGARPLAATMAGPMALAGAAATAAAAAEAVPLSVGGKSIPPGGRSQELPADGYLNTIVADRYRVLRKLGEGGMGTVYLAEHVIIEKKVALKVLSEDFARKADLVQRFMQEAKAASRIGHENIVDITDFGETPSGSVFIAMEFLEGSDLANVIRSCGALPFERARYIITQICRALGAAHAKGIIHRDIKPENIFLIDREGRPDFVKILDFGIAKVSSLDEGGSRLTRTGMIFGTPEYMSPEQARGDRPDHRVDIYAVGCILYELLTGDVPFHADTFMGVLTKHMFEQPQSLAQVAPDRNIPPDVEAVVLKAISKDRDLRFQTMKEMSMALAGCAGGDGEGWGNEPSGVYDMPAPAPKSATASVRSVAMPSSGPTVAPVTAAAPTKKTGVFTYVAAGAVLVAIGVGGAIALRPHPVVPPPLNVPTTIGGSTNPTNPATPPNPVPTPVPTPVAPAMTAVGIISAPPGADVVRDGKVLGQTPFTLTVPSDATSQVALVLRKASYKDHEFSVACDKDRSYDIGLVAQRKPGGRPNGRPQTLPGAPSPGTRPSVGPGTKPGRLRDLKDPFSDDAAKKH